MVESFLDISMHTRSSISRNHAFLITIAVTAACAGQALDGAVQVAFHPCTIPSAVKLMTSPRIAPVRLPDCSIIGHLGNC